MSNWQEVLTHLAANTEQKMDELRYRLHYQLGGPGPVKIITYRGYGTPQRIFLRGRVIEDKELIDAQENSTIWDNLVNMYRRIESDEVPHARLMARFQGIEKEVSADEEGFFEVEFEPREPLAKRRLWHSIEVELLEPIPDEQSRNPIKATGEVLVPPESAQYVVISDIDDTVIRTDAVHLLHMARNVFLGNAHSRLPFPGVAALYRALFLGESGTALNPMFYVSSSPWNLYDLLSHFFTLQKIPVGPVLFLRDWGLTQEEILPLDNHAFKIKVIRQILDTYPHLPFLLIGDSGQADPEIYADLVEEYPQRILAVYIRNVSRDLKRPNAIRQLAKRVLEAGSDLVLGDNSLAIAQHAVEAGYMQAEALDDVRENKQADEAPPTIIERILGEAPKEAGKKESGPSVKVTRQEVKKGELEEVVKDSGESDSAPPTVIVESKKKNK